MDCGDKMILFIGKVVSSFFCEKVIHEFFLIMFLFGLMLLILLAVDVWRLTAELHRRELNRPA